MMIAAPSERGGEYGGARKPFRPRSLRPTDVWRVAERTCCIAAANVPLATHTQRELAHTTLRRAGGAPYGFGIGGWKTLVPSTSTNASTGASTAASTAASFGAGVVFASFA